MAKTLYEKLFDAHLVHSPENELPILYVDRHLIHEVTSPQAFNDIMENKRIIRQIEKTFGTMDHSISTKSKDISACGQMAQTQVQALIENCQTFNISLFDVSKREQGIEHVMGPEQGLILPGMTVVCGDSHTSTHGAFGALAFGIGSSEVEHVFATQTIRQARSKTMKIAVRGQVSKGITAKDIILYTIGVTSVSGGNGHVVEYCGNVIEQISMEGRMTICNMSIELGARAGIIAPDQITFDYIKGRPYAPRGKNWLEAIEYWKSLYSDNDAIFDKEIEIEAKNISPQITWGTNPSQVIGIDETIPNPENMRNENEKKSAAKALEYMDLEPGMKMTDINIDKVFIGSCTNSRIEDLRNVAAVLKDKTIHSNIEGIIVPGSGVVRYQAEKEGLDKIFKNAGFEWRLPGCSMCLAMNDDKLNAKERCASTTNRNFEGRQGRDSRTHLVSPAMAAAAAIEGKFTDIRKYLN